jgi:S1/P1 Nuclease
MGSIDVARWSTWMDEQRDRLRTTLPGSQKWHYDDRPVCGQAPREEYCPAGDCASEQADRLMGVLADPEAPAEARQQAVLMLVHIVGDLHQPLHAGEHGDQGGNQVRVTLVGPLFPTNLHAVWDSDFVNMTLWQGPATARDGSTSMVRANAKALARRYSPQFAAWRQGSLDDWFEESRALSRRRVYDPLPGFQCAVPSQPKGAPPIALPASYVAGGREVIPGQLARAGVRIAQILNTTLEAAARRRQTSAPLQPP